MNPYSARVREYFAEPAHAGDARGGVAVLVMRFRARACPHVIAAAEAACAGLEGRPVADLIEFSAHDLMDNLSIPVEKTGRILVLEDAIRALGRELATSTGP